jgi:hypothetical protein
MNNFYDDRFVYLFHTQTALLIIIKTTNKDDLHHNLNHYSTPITSLIRRPELKLNRTQLIRHVVYGEW